MRKGLKIRDGMYHLDVMYNGKRIRKTLCIKEGGSEQRKLAERVRDKILGQLAENKFFDIDEGSKRTFIELVEKYEATEFKELKSWQSVKSYLKQLKEFFGPYKLSDITSAVIDDFKQMRKAEGVKPATIVRQLNVLKRMFNLAKKRWLWIKEVPAIEMESKADRKRLRYLSFEEYHKLLSNCDGWLKDIVTVAAWTGLRQGNILNLKRGQVNLLARTISLDSSETKNGENLIIPLAGPAFEVLKETLKVAHIKSAYVFCKTDGTPYYKMEVHRAFKAALKKAEIEDFRFHDLRHCFASWNRQAGVDIDTLADLMGHKDTRMTRRYAHISPVHLANAVNQTEKTYEVFVTKLSRDKEKGLQ